MCILRYLYISIKMVVSSDQVSAIFMDFVDGNTFLSLHVPTY